MTSFIKVRQWFVCNQGQFAIFTALILSVIISAVGLAVDHSQVNLQRSKAQDALDSAALAFANAETAENVGASNKDIKDYVASNLKSLSGAKLQPVQSEITSDGHLRVSSEVRVEPIFGKMFGMKEYAFDVESVVSLPSGVIYNAANVAISWDVSTSMTSLLPSVKAAVNTLHAELDAQGFDGEFSVFPYSQYDTNRNANTLIAEQDFALDKLAIESYINNLAIMASSPSHTDGGAACGWETLAQANDTIETVFSDDLNVIFFMHDGDGFCGADDKILEQCQIIRDRGINLISVRFGGMSSKEQLFRDCAGGDNTKYFYIDSAASAEQAFMKGMFGSDQEKYIVR